MRLFEVLGGWVATVPELDVKLVLGRHTWFHAEHAKRWDERLPELREMNRERLNIPPNPEFETFMDAVREPEAAGAHDREARRRVPGADPALHRGVHVPPERHEPDHRRADDPVAQLHPPGRVRDLARRRDAAPVADRHAGESRAGRPAATRSWRRSTSRRGALPVPVAWVNRPRRYQSDEEVPRRVRARPRRALRAHQDRGPRLRSSRREDRAAQHRPGQDGRRPAGGRRALPLVDARHLRR